MRKIDVPFVRRHVRTLRHVARIAQVAAVDDIPVLGFFDAIELAGLALVDQIEELRKRRAQVDAAPAAVTDIEHALEFAENLLVAVEVSTLPVERMAGRSFEITFADGHCAGGV